MAFKPGKVYQDLGCYVNRWVYDWVRYNFTLNVSNIKDHSFYFVHRLGDRHAENILFDERTGDCVHVDLNMLFDQGLGLTIPEVVPFRLTHNLVHAMGITSYRGTFTTTCDITMNVMLQNKDALTSVFKTLINTWSTKEVIFFLKKICSITLESRN